MAGGFSFGTAGRMGFPGGGETDVEVALSAGNVDFFSSAPFVDFAEV
jgi:hypothetical protein